jgi:hypothetical protein
MVAKLLYREGEPESAPSFPNYAQTSEKQASAVSTPDSLQQHEKENKKKQTNAKETQRTQSSTRSSGSAQYLICYSPRKRTKLTIKPTRPI